MIASTKDTVSLIVVEMVPGWGPKGDEREVGEQKRSGAELLPVQRQTRHLQRVNGGVVTEEQAKKLQCNAVKMTMTMKLKIELDSGSELDGRERNVG